MPIAPVRPVSSSRVNTHSIGPCSMSVARRSASCIAQPIPSSAPSVVPSAHSQSPSIYVSIGSLRKSISFPSMLSHTMSICDCSMTTGLCSMPGVAGLRIITLPVASTIVSNSNSLPTLSRYSIIFSSCFEGRGIALIFANSSKTIAGFNSFLVIIMRYYKVIRNFFTNFAIELYT